MTGYPAVRRGRREGRGSPGPLRVEPGQVAAVSEVEQDVAQGDVHRVGADHPLLRERQVGRHHDARAVLPAAEPAVAADEALEGGDLLGARVDEAVDVDVGRLGRDARRAARTRGPARRTAAAGRCPRPARRRAGGTVGAERDRALDLVASRRRSRRRGARPGRRRGAGNRSSSCWRGQALLLAPHVDQPEVAGAEDVEGLVAGVVATSVPRRRRPSTGRSPARARRRRVHRLGDAAHGARARTPCPPPRSSTSARVRPQPSMSSSDDGDVGAREPRHQAARSSPYRSANVAPWAWPWSERTTKW